VKWLFHPKGLPVKMIFAREFSSFSLFLRTKTAKNSEKQRRVLLFFCSPERVCAQDFCGPRALAAVNFGEKQRKQRDAMVDVNNAVE
jgi:hypothetical protein